MLGLSVQDHGVRFDAADESILSHSNVLAGMGDRATLLGGQLTPESAPGLSDNLFAKHTFKDTSASDLLQAARNVIRGQRYLSRPLSQTSLETYMEKGRSTPVNDHDLLTTREFEAFKT